MSTNTIQWPPVSLSPTSDIYACEANLKPLSNSHSSLAHQMLPRPYISTWMLANLWLLNRDKPEILYWDPIAELFGPTRLPVPFAGEPNVPFRWDLSPVERYLVGTFTSWILRSYTSARAHSAQWKHARSHQLRIRPSIFKVLYKLIKLYNNLARLSSTTEK